MTAALAAFSNIFAKASSFKAPAILTAPIPVAAATSALGRSGACRGNSSTSAVICSVYACRTGPHFRRALFQALLTDSGYSADLFLQGYPDVERSRYKRFVGSVKLILRAKMGITVKLAEQSSELVQQELDWLAANIIEHGHLVGEQFSVADLAAASVVILTSLAEGTAAYAPVPQLPAVLAWVQRWAGHPAVLWAESVYKNHRPASVTVEDCA